MHHDQLPKFIRENDDDDDMKQYKPCLLLLYLNTDKSNIYLSHWQIFHWKYKKKSHNQATFLQFNTDIAHPNRQVNDHYIHHDNKDLYTFY